MRSKFNFLFVFLLGSHLHANNKVGNGGDVIVCGETSELLDFYEVLISKETKETDPYKIAQAQISKLEKVAPTLFRQYSRRLNELPQEIDFKSEVQLEDVQDSKHLYLPDPKKCKIHQIALRKNTILKGEKRFIIQNNLWKNLSPLHQAGLLTHEIIYEHFFKLGEEDSLKARKFNAYLFQTPTLNKKFWSYLKDLEIPIYP
jgi:hypothetical protein